MSLAQMMLLIIRNIKTFLHDYTLDISSTNLFYLLGNKIDLKNEIEISRIILLINFSFYLLIYSFVISFSYSK